MAKKGGSRLDKRDAEAIAKKLQAEIAEGSLHARAVVRHQGELIATFGIRRDKHAKHGHIPGQLFVSETEAIGLARCTMSHSQWVAKMVQKGKIVKDPPSQQA